MSRTWQTWFSSRTQREQALLICMAALVAVFVVWQALLRPVIDGHAAAQQRYTSAVMDLQTVKSGAPMLGSGTAQARAPFDPSVALAGAANVNLSISRVQPGDGGGITIWFDDANVLRIYDFLNGLTQTHRVEIERVQITRGPDNLVSAQIVLRPQ